MRRRYPVGAELVDGKVHARVWAPRRRRVELVDAAAERAVAYELEAEENGYFSGFAEQLKAGSLYGFRLDESARLYPDPASRFQPSGPHGPSEVIDPHGFEWTDAEWQGIAASGRVIYELHVGTFTRQGTFAAAQAELAELAAIGVTVIELMPVAEFPGSFGWGYDGVCLFAPYSHYGRPDDLRAFVNAAHELGLGVILDVVYNHFGPDGNYRAPPRPSAITTG